MNRKEFARKIAEESIVLLKNEEQILPFPAQKEVAIFGRAQVGTLYSGNGSGGANIAGCPTILEECEKNGIIPEPLLKGFYTYKVKEEPVSKADEFDWTKAGEGMNCGIMYEIFGRYRAPLKEYEVPEYLIRQAAEKTDTALVVIGRNSGGEECDRHLTEDYYLTTEEEKLLDMVCSQFAKAVVILNVNGLIDLSWINRYATMKSLVFLGIPGEEGAAALARVLSGRVNPSGKMAVTVAERYEDYPSAAHFTWDKECPDQILTYEDYGLSAEKNGSRGFDKSPVTVYWEDIYAGYRYFDAFQKNVLFPFGHGLSYTHFCITEIHTEKKQNGIKVTARVKNIGAVSGKEVVQVYLSKMDGKGSAYPMQALKGFEKTSLLDPGNGELLCITIPWKELAVYEETKAAWVIEEGEYVLHVGNSSRNTVSAGRIRAEQIFCLEQCANRLTIASSNLEKIKFLTEQYKAAEITEKSCEQGNETGRENSENIIMIDWEDIRQENAEESAIISDSGLECLGKQKTDFSEFSIEELSSLCVGYGPGIPFAVAGDQSQPSAILDESGRPLTTNSHPAGYAGYVSPAMVEKGIKSIFYKDGPAGIGETAWPTEMLIACAFDRTLWYEFGNTVGAECEQRQVDIWLAPAVNLHRNPLCGRNFEYFSEDPYLTGVCACEIAKGVQENHPVLVCPKHFAVNEQETFRRGNSKRNYDAVDSILTERAAREIYLKPFEMLVRDAEVACIMTSFNKINGIFAGGNKDLCTHILRDEWGFKGAVVTDWGDMDVVVDGADAVAAGNDIVMPGGPPVIRQILKGYNEGRVTRSELESAVSHLLDMSGRI